MFYLQKIEILIENIFMKLIRDFWFEQFFFIFSGPLYKYLLGPFVRILEMEGPMHFLRICYINSFNFQYLFIFVNIYRVFRSWHNCQSPQFSLKVSRGTLTMQIFVNIVFLEVLILCTEKLRSNMEEFLAFHKHHNITFLTHKKN